MKKNFAFIFSLFIIFSASAQERDTCGITFHKYSGQIEVIECPTYFVDTTRVLAFEEVKKQNFNFPVDSFRKLLKKHTRNMFWIRFEIKNKTDSIIYPELFAGYLTTVNIYAVSSKRPTDIFYGGFINHISGNGDSVTIKFPLTILPGETLNIYVGFYDLLFKPKSFELSFYTHETFEENKAIYLYKERIDIICLILIFGIFIFQIIYSAMQWVQLRSREYIFYLLYILCIGLYFLITLEIGDHVDILFLHHYYFSVIVWYPLNFLSFFFYYGFIRYIFDLKQTDMWIRQRIRWLENFIVFFIVAYLILFLLNKPAWGFLLLLIVSAIISVATVIIIFYFIRKRNRLINIVITGSAIYAIGAFSNFLLAQLLDHGIIKGAFWDHTGLIYKFSVIVELLFFSTALGYKARMNEKEKVKVQGELIKKLKENERLMVSMQGIRNKISEDLHDDVGSTLSSIRIMSTVAESNPAQSTEMMRNIRDNSQRMLESMSDIVWAVNPENDLLENILVRMNQFAAQVLEPKKISFKIKIENADDKITLSMEKRRDFFLIFKEGVNNIAKYSEGSKAEIILKQTGGSLIMEIRDDGKGFTLQTDNGSKNYSGNGLKNMAKRAERMNGTFSIQSELKKGTTILLNIPLA